MLSAAATTTKGNNNYCAVLVISETQQIWYMYTHTYIIYRHTYRQAHTHTHSPTLAYVLHCTAPVISLVPHTPR